jgi:hypothetical protein
MTQEQARRPRDYGGWRRRRGIGLWGLGTAGTFAVLAGLLVLVLLAAVDVTALAFAAPLVVVAGALGVARISGEPVAMRGVRRLRWWCASVRGYTRYRVTAAARHSASFALPGVLAPVTLVSAEDEYGGRYGMAWDRRTGLLTPTLRVVAASTWLADRDDADSWVASWGGWLASLGHVPMLRWVTVTVDTAPEPGSALADAVADAIDPAAPPAARQLMAQLADAAPTATADVDTRVSLTFDPKASPVPLRSLDKAAAEVGSVLTGLESALGSCGVSVLGRMSAPEITGVVRSAFDPDARGEVTRIAVRRRAGQPAAQLGWTEAGPVGAEESPGYYGHDGGLSVTWAWHEAPRQNVTADVLARLIAPGPYAKRVSVQYRPFPAAAATRVLEAEVNAATFRAHYRSRTGREETARDAHDQAHARQAAVEEAAGAGVCLISLYITVTVTVSSDLPRAVAWVEAAAEASKIRLRRMAYSQAAGFAATLPCGICPAELGRRIRR